MPQTVEITQADDGTFTVGLTDAPSAQAQQPAASMADALKMAQHLLTSPGDTGSGADASPGGLSDDPASAASPSGQSDAPGAPPGGVPGVSSNKGAVTQDPKAIWDALKNQGVPAH